MDASDTLIDFERAVSMAQLTARQASGRLIKRELVDLRKYLTKKGFVFTV